MANDTAISGLPSIPVVASNDVLEVLDVSNTTNQPTGENTRATVASLVSGLPAFVAAGASHASGLVPDPGAAAHATPYLLGDDGQFHAVTGAGVSYGSGAFTIAGGGGGGGSPGGNNGDLQYNNAGSLGGAPLSTLLDTAVGNTQGGVLFRGAGGWNALAPGTVGFNLQSGGAAANPSWGAPRKSIFSVTGAGTQQTGTSPSSIFAGTTVAGSLTIPANRIVAGSCLHLMLLGDCDVASGDSITIAIKLGSTTILTGTSANSGSAATGRQWFIDRFLFMAQSGGAAGLGRGTGSVVVAGATANATTLAWYLTTGGSGNASTSVSLDFTTALTFDVQVNFSSASATDKFRLLAGAAWIDG